MQDALHLLRFGISATEFGMNSYYLDKAVKQNRKIKRHNERRKQNELKNVVNRNLKEYFAYRDTLKKLLKKNKVLNKREREWIMFKLELSFLYPKDNRCYLKFKHVKRMYNLRHTTTRKRKRKLDSILKNDSNSVMVIGPLDNYETVKLLKPSSKLFDSPEYKEVEQQERARQDDEKTTTSSGLFSSLRNRLRTQKKYILISKKFKNHCSMVDIKKPKNYFQNMSNLKFSQEVSEFLQKYVAAAATTDPKDITSFIKKCNEKVFDVKSNKPYFELNTCFANHLEENMNFVNTLISFFTTANELN